MPERDEKLEQMLPRDHSKIEPKLGRNLVPVVLVVGAVGLFTFGVIRYFSGQNATRWPVVIGHVTRTDVELQSSRSGESYYRIRVIYSYKVGEAAYENDKIGLGYEHVDVRYDREEQAAASAAERFPPGSPVSVHYKPGSPELSCLKPGTARALREIKASGIVILMALVWWATDPVVRRINRRYSSS